MKNTINLIVTALGIMLIINACQTPEERAREMNGGVKDTNKAITDHTATNIDAADTNTTVATSNEALTKDSAAVATNAPKKSAKGKVIISLNEPAANEKMEMDKNGVYARAEVMPSYPGGQQSLEKFVEDNLQYPQEALDNGIEGRVMISFDVDETGKIYRPMVISPKIGYGLEEEALKVVKAMPQWNPGKMKGKNVKTKFTLPIIYQLL
jgi:protein TonB